MLESRIHAYLRASASERSQRLGPFLLLLDEHDPGRYFNYAVPDDDLEPTTTNIAALVAAFRNRSRTPRLEYLSAACPALEPALLAAGFVIEARVPILTCSPDNSGLDDVVAREPAGVEVRRATQENEIRQVAHVQAEAYGQSVVTDHDTARLSRVIDSGGLVALAVEKASGVAVGAGQLGPPHPPRPSSDGASEATPVGEPCGVSELAAVGVRATYRRRGIATAVAAALTRSAPGVGVTTPFLMTLGEAEERVYQRVGYRRAAEMLHISMP